jgi:hypothetical protein
MAQLAVRVSEAKKVPKYNLCPDFDKWTMYGNAYVENGVLILPDSDSYAESPFIDVNRLSSWTFSADFWDDELGPIVTSNEDGTKSTRHLNSFYYDTFKNSTTNSDGYTGNGNARAFGYPNEWSRNAWGGIGGQNVKYIKIRVIASTVYTSGSYKARKPMMKTDGVTTFEPYQEVNPPSERMNTSVRVLTADR